MRFKSFLTAVALLALSSLAGAQTLVLTANPTSANLKVTPTLSWSGVPSTSTCTASGGWSGTKATSSVSMPQTEITRTTRYTLTCAWPAAPASTGSATITWTAPTTNTDGTPLTDLARYNVVYGGSPTTLAATAVVTAPTTSAVIGGLTSGTWYFAVNAENADGVQSVLSNVASKVVTANAGSPAGSSTASVDVVIKPAPMPPTIVSVAVIAGQTLTPVMRILGRAGTNYPGEVFGLIPAGRECTGPVVFKYRGVQFRRVAVNASEVWPSTTSTENLAAPCA